LRRLRSDVHLGGLSWRPKLNVSGLGWASRSTAVSSHTADMHSAYRRLWRSAWAEKADRVLA
jgi:hypothetical protein